VAFHPPTYKTAVKLQRFIEQKATADTNAKDLGILARALCELETLKRKLKMRPDPRPVDVTKLPRERSRRVTAPDLNQ